MNIILTTKCKNTCAYCFARDIINKKNSNEYMTIDDFEKILEFLKKSGSKSIRLLGGEPLLHPEIKNILDISIKEDWAETIDIFTGGIFPKKLKNLLIRDQRYHIIININERRDYSSSVYESIVKLATYLADSGVGITLSFTIWRDDFEWHDHLNLMKNLGILTLRWSLASPSSLRSNEFLSIDKKSNFGARIAEFLLDFSNQNIRTVADCSVPLCIFSDEMRGRIERVNPSLGRDTTLGLCSVPVDIGPGLKIWRCFAVDAPSYLMTDFKNLRDIERTIQKRDDFIRWMDMPTECLSCDSSYHHVCQGGCLGFRNKNPENYSIVLKNSNGGSIKGTPSNICDQLFKIAQSNKQEIFIDTWTSIRSEPLFSQCSEAILLDACLSELKGNEKEALGLWRKSLLFLNEDKKDWVKNRIKHLS